MYLQIIVVRESLLSSYFTFQVPGDSEPEEKEKEEEKQTFTRRLSTYDLLLMQISKYDKNKLRKASTVRHQCHGY